MRRPSLELADAPAADRGERGQDHHDGTRGKALVVDDDPMMVKVLRQLLESRGWTVREAASSAAGLAALEAEPVQLIVSDYAMPGGDGVSFLQRVAQDFPASVRVLCSGSRLDQRLADAVAAGIAHRRFYKGDDLQALLAFAKDLTASTGEE